jgi:uncharacterized damage-inducible protein DinB
MLTAVMRDYYEYTRWANERILDAASRIAPDRFLAADLRDGWSIRDSLVHVMISQWAWVERWNGRTPDSFPEEAEFPDVASIRDHWVGVYAAMDALFDRWTDDDLASDLAYTNFRGERYSYPIWEQLLQVANHSTYHRGEIAALLTHDGASPGELDFLIYRDQTRTQAG